jgi:PhnB protein
MSKLSTHLNFNGNCEEALNFYANVLGGLIEFKMTWGESPMSAQMPAEEQDKIMHMSMRMGGDTLMGADAPPNRFQKAQGMTVSISMDEVADAKKAFEALADGGQTTMPFQETFWAKGFGMCTDKFGTPWMVNCEKQM